MMIRNLKSQHPIVSNPDPNGISQVSNTYVALMLLAFSTGRIILTHHHYHTQATLLRTYIGCVSVFPDRAGEKGVPRDGTPNR